MSVLVVLFGLLLSALGLVGLVDPQRLIRFAGFWQTPIGLYAGAALRVVVGLLLVLVAPQSRAPAVLRILGVVILLIGVATPFFGLARFHRVLEWWAARGPAFQRAWAGCAVAAGVLLIYAVA